MCAAHAPTCSVLHAPRASPTSDLVGEPLLRTRTTQLAIARPRAPAPKHGSHAGSCPERYVTLSPPSPQLSDACLHPSYTAAGEPRYRHRAPTRVSQSGIDRARLGHWHATSRHSPARVPARRPADDCWRVPISIKLRAAYRVRRMPSGIVPSAPAGDPDWALALGHRVRAGHAEIVAGRGATSVGGLSRCRVRLRVFIMAFN